MEQLRLLLTSSGLTHASFQQTFVDLLKSRNPYGFPKVLYIPDAAVGNGYDVQTGFLELQTLLARLMPCRLECCELRRTTPATLAHHLLGVDAIYVDKGNTFYLRYFMGTSGFEDLVPPLLKEGVVYVGASSGSIVLGATINIAFWKGWDNPGYGEPWDLSHKGYDGLALIPEGRSLFPHYNDFHHDRLVRQQSPSLDHDLLLLGEDYAYVVGCGRGEHILTASGEVCDVSSAIAMRQSNLFASSKPPPLLTNLPHSGSVACPAGMPQLLMNLLPCGSMQAPAATPFAGLSFALSRKGSGLFSSPVAVANNSLRPPAPLTDPWLSQHASPTFAPTPSVPRTGMPLLLPLRAF